MNFKSDISTILILTLLVGLVYVFPHIIYLHTSQPYNPLAIETNAGGIDESLYAAGVMEVLEGRFIPSDLATYEHKGGPFFYGPFPFLTMALVAKSVGGIRNAIIFSDFLFSALAFFLFYLLSNKFLKDKQLSIISSLFLVFFYRLFIPPASISVKGLLNHLTFSFFNIGGGPANLWFSRFVQPQVPTALFFLTLLFVFWSLDKRRLGYYIFAGILLALNFYSYFYFWTYLLVFLSLLFALLLYKKSRQAVGILITLCVGGILSIPYFLNLLLVSSSPLAARSGIETGRFIETISIIYFLLTVISFLLIRKKDLYYYFLSLLMLSGVVVLNVQLLLGFTIQNNHWNSRVIVPILILFLFYHVKSLLYRLNQQNLLKKFTSIAVVILFILAINIQIHEVSALKDDYSFPEGGYELLNWLNDNTSPNSVIMTSDLQWNMLIPAYTYNNVYLPYSASTLSSQEEINYRFISTYKILNKSDQDIATQLNAKSDFVRIPEMGEGSDCFNTYLRSYILLDSIYPLKKQGIFKKRTFNQTNVVNLVKGYKDSTFEPTQIKHYKVDYILLVGEEKLLYNTTKQYFNSTKAFEGEYYTILSV